MDFGTQSYRGQTVIAFWQGVVATAPRFPNSKFPPGAPVRGQFYLYNNKYHQIKTFKAQGKGWVTDFHELVITKPTAKYRQGTAIFLAATKKHKNLHPYGGTINTYEDEEIQQINLANDHLIFHWDVDQHIKLRDSKRLPGRGAVWDPYHANSIDVNKSGDMLLSLRNTWGVYAISPGGRLLWQVGGKCVVKKCLQPTKAARFAWQHDVQYDGKTKISMFDDACCAIGVYRGSSGHLGAARGLVLSLNFSKKRAGVVRQYRHANTHTVLTGGSFRFLSDGHAFIGWGDSPYYSEYTDGGSMLYDAAMPKGDSSYRTFKATWSATPSYKPSAAAREVKHKITVYASWNGATTVARWKVLAGKSAKTVKSAAGQAKRSGFETAIHVSNKGPYYVVEAIDSHGKPIPGGTSKPVKVS